MTDPLERPALPVDGLPGVAVLAADQVDGITIDLGDLAVVQAPYEISASMTSSRTVTGWSFG